MELRLAGSGTGAHACFPLWAQVAPKASWEAGSAVLEELLGPDVTARVPTGRASTGTVPSTPAQRRHRCPAQLFTRCTRNCTGLNSFPSLQLREKQEKGNRPGALCSRHLMGWVRTLTINVCCNISF